MPKEQKQVTMSQEQFNAIMERLNATETALENKQVATPQSSNVQLGPQGQVMGVIERMSIDPRSYQNPIDELLDDPEFKRFSLRENFELEYTCTPTRYETKQGVWYTEPRFELKLKRLDYDANGNVKRKIILGTASFFEDVPANYAEAAGAGVSLDDIETGTFNDKMRMYRYRLWLKERLIPPSRTDERKRIVEEVIGGRAYQVEVVAKVQE